MLTEGEIKEIEDRANSVRCLFKCDLLAKYENGEFINPPPILVFSDTALRLIADNRELRRLLEEKCRGLPLRNANDPKWLPTGHPMAGACDQHPEYYGPPLAPPRPSG